jgi:hypothetical protein
MAKLFWKLLSRGGFGKFLVLDRISGVSTEINKKFLANYRFKSVLTIARKVKEPIESGLMPKTAST